MIIHVTLTEDQKAEAARELDLNSLLNIVLSKTMSNKDTIELGMKIQEYLTTTNEGRTGQQEEESITPAEPIEQKTQYNQLENT